MKKVLINYSDQNFRKKQKWNSISGKIFGSFDRVIEYSPSDLDTEFKEKNKKTLSAKRGGGYWLWKPYIVLKALNEANNDDYIFYSDSGCVFIKSINPLIKLLKESKKDIMAFQHPLIEKQWTKRDAFILMDCDSPKYTDTPQMIGGFVLVKKTLNSISFFTEYLKFGEDERIITDIPNTQGKLNYNGFIDNRHDQSIFSLLCKKSKCVLIYTDITDYGVFPKKNIHSEDFIFSEELMDSKDFKFKGLILSNRHVHPVKYFIKYAIKRVFRFLKLKKYN